MGRRNVRVSVVKPNMKTSSLSLDPKIAKSGLSSPFSDINSLDRDDFREAAYEVFFTACRSSPGFGGNVSRSGAVALSYYVLDGGDGAPGSPLKSQGVGMAVTSRVKMALGLKMLRRSLLSRPSLRRVSSSELNSSSPTVAGTTIPRLGATVLPPGGRPKRPMTSAEIMRQQMNVTEQSDNRLRKTLTRTLVGQMGRRAETIILPLELLRHLKPSEFNDVQDYHRWQKRQLRILEAGLLLHPSTPLQKSNPHATKLRNIISTSEEKPFDTGRNSRTMKTLSDCVNSLACRGRDGNGAGNACHWTDGYPLNVHIYMALLHSIFDPRDETQVLDEVDELLELMKKTWSLLGFNKAMHNLCFTWVMFEQFVATGQVEPDLLGAAFVMLKEVENDAKNKADGDPIYMQMLAGVLAVMRKWAESRLLDYHSNFNRETAGIMADMLPLLSWSSKILEEDVPIYFLQSEKGGGIDAEVTGNRVDYCIRSSLRNAFAKVVEEQNGSVLKNNETQVTSEMLIKMANKTEELAAKERDIFSPITKEWSPAAAGIALVTLHTCYGIVLKQYLTGKTWQMNEILLVLQRAGKLEKSLMEMAVEECRDCEGGGKGIVKQMVPYEVDSIITKLVKQWVQERLNKGKEFPLRAKQTEAWNPKSKTEPYANSAAELVAFAKETVENFFQLAANVSENLYHDFVNGLESVFLDYIAFVSSCGSKQNYLPNIPPPTRCSHGSSLFKLLKKAACSAAVDDYHKLDFSSMDSTGNNLYLQRTSTSRGTQRVYIRLNTLHYLTSQLQSLEESLSASPNVIPSKTQLGHPRSRSLSTCSYFEKTLSSLQSASQQVSEVAAYRLIFLDSHLVLYGGLYIRSVAHMRIGPAIESLRQNLKVLCMTVVECAQPLVLKKVIRASFEAFVRVLLVGGSSRMFSRTDHQMIQEDLNFLKRLFCVCGEGLVAEDTVEREAEAVQGVMGLMGESTEQLIEDFSNLTNGGSGMNIFSPKNKIPIPPTTGNWSRSDPNTVLRVLCSRKDRTANDFLKKTLHLAKRRPAGFKML